MFNLKNLPEELRRFHNPKIPKESVIGTYLWPLRYFGEPYISPDGKLPRAHAEIIDTLHLNGTEIFITRNGGFFARVPNKITGTKASGEPHFEEWEQFIGEYCEYVNIILCELTLNGIISEPTSPAYVGLSHLVENHALIVSAVGMRESYWERTTGPKDIIIKGGLISEAEENLVNDIKALALTNKLLSASITPALIVAAYSHYSRQQAFEVIACGWIAIEQILGHLSKVKQKENACKKINNLLVLQIIDQELHDKLHECRNLRNGLMHKGKITGDASNLVIETLKSMIEIVCEAKVAFPEATQSMLLW